MSDAADPQQEFSEEELKAYLAELREAPLNDVVAQTVSILLNAAQVKLGRPDARTLIDMVAAVRDTAGGALDQRLVAEVDNALTQLRMAQVEAEKQGQTAPAADASQATPGDTPTSAPPPTPPRQEPPSGGQSSSRLWTPGQP